MSLPLVPFPKTGYICAWAPDNELRVLGKRNGFLRPLGGGLVSAQRLEAVYAHRCPMVHQIWVHCESQTPLVAVVSLDREAIYRWLQARKLDFERSEEHTPQIKRAVLAQLAGVAERCRLPPWERVRAVHVVAALGQADDDHRHLAAPTFVLRRGHLRRRYEKELKALLKEIEREHLQRDGGDGQPSGPLLRQLLHAQG